MYNKEKQSYLYEIKLPVELMQKLKYFANQSNEEIDLCIQRTLKAGLIARKNSKENYRNELYKTLEETEEKLREVL